MAKCETAPSLDQLRCIRCKFYLSVGPVRLVDEGYTCGRCREESGCIITIYNVVAQSFLFPCRYESSGCTQKFPYGRMEQHEIVCDKQPFFCPSLKNCDWQGLRKNVHKHFLQEHPDDVIENNKAVRVDVVEDNSRCVLFVCGTSLYFVDLVFEEPAGLKLSVMQCGLEDSPSRYNAKLVSEDGSKELALNSQDASFYISQRNPALIKTETIRTSTLEFFEAERLRLELSFPAAEDKDPLKVLECPVCIEYMLPPIYLCDTGHSFCHSCTKKVNVCSFCKSRFTSRRNYALENFADLAYPRCKNSRLGCSFRSNLEEVKLHELACERYQCPLMTFDSPEDPEVKLCRWYGTYEEMVAHSLNAHICTEKDSFSGTCNVHADKESFLLFYTHGYIFKLCSKTMVTRSLQFNAQFVGPRDAAEDFGVVVQFCAGRSKLAYHEPCRFLPEKKDPFEDCLTIPYEILVPFIENRCIVRVHIKIVKVVDRKEICT